MHDVLSFADDVTGVVQDLLHAPHFLSRVQDFCATTGMQLDVDKAVIFPFRPLNANDIGLEARLQDLGVCVLRNGKNTTFLGIVVGPSVSPSLQLTMLLARFQKICVSWRWRARIL